jgi:hypothetical protein
MKAKSKKIAAMVSFGISMTALAWLIYCIAVTLVIWYAYDAGWDWVPGTAVIDLTYMIISTAVMFVFLGLYLSFKRKHKMF